MQKKVAKSNGIKTIKRLPYQILVYLVPKGNIFAAYSLGVWKSNEDVFHVLRYCHEWDVLQFVDLETGKVKVRTVVAVIDEICGFEKYEEHSLTYGDLF